MNDAELFAAFQSCTLPAAAWTHEAHLRMAWLHLKRHAFDEAHVLLRVGIIRLNASHGLTETAQRGYHETVTRAYLAIVAHAMAGDDAGDSLAFLKRHGQTLAKGATLRYYSADRVNSVEARARFVEPDLAPLPASSR